MLPTTNYSLSLLYFPYMTKPIKTAITGVLVLIGGFYLLNDFIYNEKQGEGLPQSEKDAAYVVEGQLVQLANGMAQKTIPDSSEMIETRYFGNEARGDLNGDGMADVAFLLTQQSGGTGTFFYVVAALGGKDGYRGSQAFFLGDRIAPQTTNIGEGGIVIVNYADRGQDEPMSAQPSVGKTVRLTLNPETLELTLAQ